MPMTMRRENIPTSQRTLVLRCRVLTVNLGFNMSNHFLGTRSDAMENRLSLSAELRFIFRHGFIQNGAVMQIVRHF